MKKTLVFSAIIGMYVLLCGCPYQVPSTGTTGPVLKHDNGYDLDPNILNSSRNFPEVYKGISSTIRFVLTSPRSPATQPYNIYSLNITANTPGVAPVVFNFPSVTFSTFVGGTKRVMDIADNLNNHYFVVMDSLLTPGGVVSGLNLMALPNNMPTIKVGDRPEYNQTVENYLNILRSGLIPQETDGGYDKDTEIKSATISLPGNPGATVVFMEDPSAHRVCFTKIQVVIMVVLILLIGIFVGAYLRRKKR